MPKASYELIVAEKPNAAQKIADALADGKIVKKTNQRVSYYELEHSGKKIVVACAVGHLFTLAEKKKKAWHYPIFEYEWKPTFEVNKDAQFVKPYLDTLEKLAEHASLCIVATDYDVEGSVIGYNIVRFLCHQEDGKRMKFSTLTPDELREAYEQASPHLDFDQIESGLTRHGLDWLWGLNLTRALTLSVKSASGGFKLLSAGRVQGPSLKLLYDREKEIQAFQPEPYWEISLKGEIKGKELLFQHKDDRFTEKKKADAIHKKIQGKPAVVSSVEKREVKQKPPVPFDLTSLQIEAYSVLGVSPHRTLELAQDLYSNGWISYPRTSSQKLPESIQYKKILKGLQSRFTKEVEFLLAKGTLKPNEGLKTDPAHPAIYPTGILPKSLEGPISRLYELIVRRFFSVFGEEAKRETVTIHLDIAQELFLTKGTRTIEQGWFTLYGPFVKLDEEELPAVIVGEKVPIRDILLDEKQTQPPRRYTEASIIKELEKRNLGTKATRAQIIQNLYDRNYIKDKSLVVTDLGMKIVDTLHKYCPEILDEALTRAFEEDMELIFEHKKKSKAILDDAEVFLTKVLTRFKLHEKDIGAALGAANIETRQKESFLGACPKCKEGELHIRRGKFGFFAACSKYPECKTTFGLPKNAKVLSAEKSCTQCTYPLLKVLRARRKPQEICLNPECPTKKVEDEALDKMAASKKCPNCGTTLVVKKSFYGAFFACPGYPKCKHIEKIPEEPVKA